MTNVFAISIHLPLKSPVKYITKEHASFYLIILIVSGQKAEHIVQELKALFRSRQYFLPECQNRSDLLNKMTSMHNSCLIIIFQKGKLSYAC